MILLLAQVDDCTGETLAEALDELIALGAHNVQLLSSVTKKGRPGHVLLVDADAGRETELAAYLATELGVWGYHVMESTHRHLDVTQETRTVAVRTEADGVTHEMEAPVRVKLFRHSEVVRVKADHDDIQPIRAFLARVNHALPLDVIQRDIEAVVRQDPAAERVEVTL